jgi:proteasome lid subunit RPN8/RPN11|tara:strand:- start:8411 stop:8830 length:420 start_codon:yes stop_codon:yes gene_type:complete
VVIIKEEINNQLKRICEVGFPDEVCGVLIGKMEDNNFVISDFKICENTNHERSIDRYELNPKDFMSAEKYAKDHGLDIVGIYHSHPSHPAIASETDKLYAWPGFIYLIYSIYENRYKDLIGWIINEELDKFETTKISIS